MTRAHLLTLNSAPDPQLTNAWRAHCRLTWLCEMLHRSLSRFIRPTAPSGRAGRLSIAASRRKSHLTAPWLVDDPYLPRFQLLSPQQEAKKRSQAYAHLSNCNLCPRLCGVNRFERRGTCLIGADVVVNTIAPHFGEEPCLQGHNGSGSGEALV